MLRNPVKKHFHNLSINPRNLTTRACENSYEQPSVKGNIPRFGLGIAVGQSAHVERTFTKDDVARFGHLVGDENPLHSDLNAESIEEDALKWMKDHPLVSPNNTSSDASQEVIGSSKTLVHGMLVSSLFSCIFGTLIPGSVYLKQSLDFVNPVYCHERVRATVSITAIRHYRRQARLVATCDTTVHLITSDRHTQADVECVRGQAKVWILNGTVSE